MNLKINYIISSFGSSPFFDNIFVGKLESGEYFSYNSMSDYLTIYSSDPTELFYNNIETRQISDSDFNIELNKIIISETDLTDDFLLINNIYDLPAKRLSEILFKLKK